MDRICRTLIAVLLIGAGVGCSSRVDLDELPIGTPVEVTRQDGGVIRGPLTARDDKAVQMGVGPASRSIARDEISSVQLVDGTTPPPLPAVARFREFTVPDGTVLAARLDSSLGSDTSQVEDRVQATLTEAVLVEGAEVLPAGSVVTGVVTTADPAGKVTGRATLAVRFRSMSVAGETYAVSASLHHTAASTKKDDAKKIGIPAAGGAIIGAIVGGKKGAGIGATVGGGAGAAVVLATSGPEVRWPVGTPVSIELDNAIDVRVPIDRAARR
jgi:hypothetical protein